jgi:hypothetical protein
MLSVNFGTATARRRREKFEPHVGCWSLFIELMT